MGIFAILLIILVVIYHVSFWKIFQKAGRTEKWEGFIPIYNLVIWLKILKKPWWWVFFFFIPFVNMVVAIGCNVETARMFGKYKPLETVLTILLPWYMIPKLAYDKDEQVEAPTIWEKKEDRERRKLHDHIALFFMAPFVGHALLVVFKLMGSKRKEGKGSMEYEWTNAIGFAIVAASIIRVFFFEAFTIPTGSMEKTMRIGDFNFVNKLKFGARGPMYPMALPFIHNRIPGTMIKSYLTWLELPYFRLPGYGEMTREQIMVFNWPVGDSVLAHPEVAAHDYYAFVRNNAYVNAYLNNGNKLTPEKFVTSYNQFSTSTRNMLNSGGALRMMDTSYNIYTQLEGTQGLQTLVLDKKENYIKRCVAQHGDVLEIKDAQIYINGKPQTLPPEAQYQYRFYFKEGAPKFSLDYLDETYDIYIQDVNDRSQTAGFVEFQDITCTPENYLKLSNEKRVDTSYMKIEPLKTSPISTKYGEWVQYCPIFPNHPNFNWSRDNFGPLTIPEEGWTIELTEENWILYGRTITAYEGNESAVKKGGEIYINGKKETQYTFKQNYYWMMGDNRHGSVDSRYWGFVGEDHIVGTASFIWMSKHPEKGLFDGGIRWSRVFSFVE